jgi:outer membrane protein TolC
MRARWVRMAAAVGLAFACGADGAPDAERPGTGRPAVVAVVADGPCAESDLFLDQIEKELAVLRQGEHGVRFKRRPEFLGQWQTGQVARAFEAAMADPETDLLLLDGSLTFLYAAAPGRLLAKPAVGALFEDETLAGLPVTADGRSAKTNLAFVVVPRRAERDLAMFRRMIPFQKLAVLVDAMLLQSMPDIRAKVEAAERDLGARLDPVPVGLTAAETLARLPADADAVYFTPVLRMPAEEWSRLIAGVNARRLPSFSMLGHEDVRLGVLAGLSPDIGPRLARRVAIALHQILSDVPPETLPVHLAVEERLLINARTAAEIGYAPPFEVMIAAAFANEEALYLGEPLTLEQALAFAVENSPGLAARRAETDAAAQDRLQSRSALLPQVEASGQYQRVDRGRAVDSMGSQPQERTAAGITATQILYNDGVWTRLRANSRSLDAARGDQESARLDAVADAARAYLGFLQALALLRTEADNLALTRHNLEVARLRHQAGAVGPEDVYRWESDEATRNASLIKASATLEKAMIALNHALGFPQDRRWSPRDIPLREGSYHFLDGRLERFILNDRDLALFGGFVVAKALAQSPELLALDQRIEALQLQLDHARRRFVLPEVALQFGYDRVLDRTYAGFPADQEPDPTRDEWSLTAQATFPLWESGGKVYAVRKAAAQVAQYRHIREQTRQSLEQRARAALAAIGGSYPNVALQRAAAAAARKNLDVLKEQYASGSIPVVALLDAQNGAFVAGQGAVLAVYGYLADIYDLQRAMSWFEWEKTEDEKQAFIDDLAAHMRRQAPQGRTP